MSPGFPVFCGVFPFIDVDHHRLQVALDGVLVAQFSVENLPGQTIRLHAVHVAQPTKASLHEHRRNAHEAGSLEDLRVQNLVLPSDLQQAAKRAEVEAVEASLLSSVRRPRLTAIEESRQDAGLVDQDLCPFAQQAVAPDSLVQLGHDPCSFGDRRAMLSLSVNIRSEQTKYKQTSLYL